jgi:hypothetical protein
MTSSVSKDPSVGQDVRSLMWDMIIAYRTSQVVHVAARLSLAEHCAKGVVTAAQISRAESTDPGATGRLLRACAALGLMTCRDDEYFDGTPLLDILRRDAEGSQWGFAMSLPAPGHWLPWGQLEEAVRTGLNQGSATGAENVFAYYDTHLDEAAPFFEGVNAMTAVAGAEAARMIDTSGATLAVDVGSATGTLLHELMALNPTLRGIAFDVPDVAEQAGRAATKLGMADRLSAQGGDFFVSVPEGADIYLLRYVLHDWDDLSCTRILRNCREAMRPGARIYVLEMPLGTIGTEDKLVPLQDINMLCILHGRERSVGEYGDLFEAAGLRCVSVRHTNSPIAVFEAVAR